MCQKFIIYGIGILVVIYLCTKIYRFFCCKSKGVSHCDGCPGCLLKEKNKETEK